jgi:hypothetical protein
MKPAFKDVCRKQECMTMMESSCDKILECGHYCRGFNGEQHCLPCLDEECVKKNPQLTLDLHADSYCSICYTSGLGE